MEGSGKIVSQKKYLEEEKILQAFTNHHVLLTGKSLLLHSTL